MVAVLPEMVDLLMVRKPALKKAPPPYKVEFFAPETVTPEMVKSPAPLMVKILKSPCVAWLASMISKEAPRPVIVTVPAVDAFWIFGNAAAKVIVKGLVPEAKAKVMMSSLGALLARVMASLKEVRPSVGFTVSAVVVTTSELLTAYAPISEVIRVKPR